MPYSPMRPRFENATVNLAVSAAKRMSHINACTRPSPAAAPFTAAMTGFGMRVISSWVRPSTMLRSSRPSFGGASVGIAWSVPMSAPAQ